MRGFPLLAALALSSPGAQVWTVRVEEPTGLYRRGDEVIAVPLGQLGGNRNGFRVVDTSGGELPWQVAGKELLFPVSVVPGELPAYRVTCCPEPTAASFKSQITLRKLGMRRVELGNSRFHMVIDTGAAAIIEAYNLTAGPQRVLNLVETTPEDPKALRDDMHASDARALPQTGVTGENTGWTSLGGSGEFTGVELLETGPLRGRLRLRRAGESWEMVWAAAGTSIRWKARRGFRFASVSASPYLPFDRFVGGSEYEWPAGPGGGEPPDHRIGARQWTKLPGGHCVYYRKDDNYGALGIVALDTDLNWRGVGSRRFQAEKAAGEAEIAVTFPEWKGNETVLEARRESGILRQPLLVRVEGPMDDSVAILRPAAREPHYEIRTGAAPSPPFQPDALSLDGEWELAYGDKGAAPQSAWRKVSVPGTVHTQWLDQADWYTRKAEWLSGKEWWYRKRFLPPSRFLGRRLRLQFDATDYYADAWLNGAWLGRHEGYIDPYEYEVAKHVRPDVENELLVRVWTPVTYYWRHRPYTIKGAYGAVDQKPDDITATGITRSVRLLASDRAIIRDVAVDTRLVENGAEVEVKIDADAPEDEYQWLLTLAPRNLPSTETYAIRAPVADRQARFVIPVANPRLWWTWDHGRPDLYTLDIRLLNREGVPIDGRALAVGIREIEKIGWHFYLNRRRMFIRGTNYYFNLFLSEMNRGGYERDLDLMLRMNVNMIRLHCHFTNREFYELADEKGVLVWQDFLEAWYPRDADFSRRAAALYDAHIRYVRNHPSVAIWATSDEEDLENYADLTKHLAPRLFLYDPQRRAVVRSTGRYGDAHVYHGWYGGSIWEYAKMTEPFVSELGATSLPNYESLIKFLPNHWPIRDHAAEWTFRKLQIPEAMRAWGDPGHLTLREYIPRTQRYVARLFQLALERMRRLKYQPAGGILHFHAIDTWPSVTMAAIDFYRTPAKVFDTVRRSFAPVLASLEYDRTVWRSGEEFRGGLWAVNDTWSQIRPAVVSWRILDWAEKVAASGEFSAPLEPDSSTKLGEIRWRAAAPGYYRLVAEVKDGSGVRLSENIYEFIVKAAASAGPRLRR